MKIRDLIFVLTVGLGLTLILIAALFLRDEVTKLNIAQRLQASNNVREELLVASTALARERTETFLKLAASPERSITDKITVLREDTNAALAAAENALRQGSELLPQERANIEMVAEARANLARLRQQVDPSFKVQDQIERRRNAANWLSNATALIDHLQTTRLGLLNENRPTDPVLAAEANIRAFTDILHQAIAFNEAIGVAFLTSNGVERATHITTIEKTIGRMELAWQMMGNELKMFLSPQVLSTVRQAQTVYLRTYNPMQISLVRAAPSITTAPLIGSWERTSDESLDALRQLQETLLASSRQRLEDLVQQGQRSAVAVTLATLAGILAAVLIFLVVRRRVIAPLSQISQAMVRLAGNDLATPVPRPKRLDEVGVMTKALRTFKANAISRQRTQQELQRVHQDLGETYNQMRRDLEAAATIQLAMLPAPNTVAGVSHTGLYTPSSLIAGDTYNVIAQPNGGVGFFQIDVAGHGAAAALVSVAGQHTLSQAILTRPPDARLEDIVAEVNRNWPEELPYFTAILGEIDPEASIARIVQAGHPSPLLIRFHGKVEYVGESGFPVGMLPQAQYETLEFDFRSGDRLLIYSDGVIETENSRGTLYSESRLLDLIANYAAGPTSDLLTALQASLREWRGGTELTDDVSVLVVERTNAGNHHAVHRNHK